MPKFTSTLLKKEYIVLTDTGKNYNKTDLNFDTKSPNARIIFGGWATKDLAFVLFENDGIESQSHLLVFKTIDKKNTAIESKFLNCRPVNFSALKNCFR